MSLARIKEEIDKCDVVFVAAGALAVALALTADGLIVAVGRVLTPWSHIRRTV
jgi:Na+(H+)/acetate symporter ActP